MTLTKAIEAARVAMARATSHLGWSNNAKKAAVELNQALAALPDKPMTEDQLEGKIGNTIAFYKADGNSYFIARKIIQKLKSDNVLYIEEK